MKATLLAFAALVLIGAATAQTPLSPAFTYQGTVDSDGTPINGAADFQFSLWTAAVGGNSVSRTDQHDAVSIVDGVFTVELDFGRNPFSGTTLWLQIEVRHPSQSPAGFETLQPRQRISATPFAIHALNGALCARSIADLRALAIPSAPTGTLPCAQVLGYHTAGDGGAGLFYWDEHSGATTNGGTIVSSTNPAAPPAGRWIRSFSGPVHSSWWGFAGDGSDETAALQSAFAAAAGRGIVFDQPQTYGFRSVFTIPADTRIENHGATFLLVDHVGGADVAMALGDRVAADPLKVHVAPGIAVRRLVSLGHDNEIERLVISSSDQQSLVGSNLDGALQIRSNNVRLGRADISDFDMSALVYQASHLVIENLRITDFINGLHVRESNFLELVSAHIPTPSPGATTDPGHNGLLFEISSDVVASDVIIHDAGEHAIRIGGAGDSSRFVFSNIQCIRPGQCGLKINPNDGQRVRDVQINGLTVVDAAATSTPGTNEDGLRLEKCSYVTVNGFQVEKRDRAVSCFAGIYINSCDFVTINGPRVSNPASHGIHLQDLNTLPYGPVPLSADLSLCLL